MKTPEFSPAVVHDFWNKYIKKSIPNTINPAMMITDHAAVDNKALLTTIFPVIYSTANSTNTVNIRNKIEGIITKNSDTFLSIQTAFIYLYFKHKFIFYVGFITITGTCNLDLVEH